MKRCILIVGLMMLSLGITHNTAWGQDTGSTLYKIEMRDGNVFFGTIVSENEQVLVLRTDESGEIELQKSNIKSKEAIDPDRFKNGKYWFDNPNSTRYLFAPNGLGLEKGEGYYKNTWLFANSINIGITNNFSLGAGTIFGLGLPLPFWVIPKFSVPIAKDKLNVAVGGVFARIEEGHGFVVPYGVVTYGNRDSNITFGTGIPLFFNLSGMYRLSPKFYFISENYFFPDDDGVLTAAFRWSPENFAVDLGVGFFQYEFQFEYNFTWLGVSIPFGK